MPKGIRNPYRHRGISQDGLRPIASAKGVAALLELCPAHQPTPLIDVPHLAEKVGAARFLVKDERGRMGLGSFKALGAAHAIAREAAAKVKDGNWQTALCGRTYVTASAGNHGMSVAAGAKLFGAQAVIYLAQTVPEAFAQRLTKMGATVMREGADYEASMTAAALAAEKQGWTLLSDSSWPGYTELPLRVMEGYLQLADEAAEQFDKTVGAPPTHLFLQAGVGGLAAAVAAHARAHWGDAPTIIVVEPEAAPALYESIRAGELVTAPGPVSAMGRLDCKTPSMIALEGLARDADHFVAITETEAAEATNFLATIGLETTPSGGAGIAAALAGFELGSDARVLCYLSEGPERG
ncbi:pyridoxal-phosphate dependent enzyme [Thioclava sp. FR2]|uniref:pyridoxal-phosphate dependent enzyme n=1 Tax=Thioclava sp. FR2 TaxID=3445780 RepID=UPI003EB6C3B9